MVFKYATLVTVFLIILVRISQGVPARRFNIKSGNALEDSENVIEADSEYYDDSDESTSPKTEKTAVRTKMEMKQFEKRLDDFLDWYYEKYINPKNVHNKVESKVSQNKPNAIKNSEKLNFKNKPHDGPHNSVETQDPHDVMQSDQPAFIGEGDGPQRLQELDHLSPLYVNLSSMVNLTRYSEENNNFTDIEYIRALRNRRDSEVEDRTKDTWIQMLKDNILRQVGRVNSSMPKTGEEIEITTLNISQLMPSLHIPNDSFIDDEFVAEKIRSFYPSCEIPRNTDQDVWKDENTMNLYFNVEHGPEENGISIATATLRLYRLPQENTSAAGNSDSSCENSSAGEDDGLLRISIYWYTKSLKKHRVKRRLSDSKVIGESAKWVELSVRPATRAWVKGRNLGLAVLVEDQDGSVLKADKYFKGASCTVGTSTPKPIPTVIVDAARWANELERGNGNSGGNSTTTLHNHVSLLPTIDICTLEFPQNFSYNPMSITNLRINACDLKKMHDQTQKSLERERLEKFAALAGFVPSSRHIRHQRQHLQGINVDPRSRIVGQQIVLTNEELRNYNAQLAQNNFTNINR